MLSQTNVDMPAVVQKLVPFADLYCIEGRVFMLQHFLLMHEHWPVELRKRNLVCMCRRDFIVLDNWLGQHLWCVVSSGSRSFYWRQLPWCSVWCGLFGSANAAWQCICQRSCSLYTSSCHSLNAHIWQCKYIISRYHLDTLSDTDAVNLATELLYLRVHSYALTNDVVFSKDKLNDLLLYQQHSVTSFLHSVLFPQLVTLLFCCFFIVHVSVFVHFVRMEITIIIIRRRRIITMTTLFKIN